MFVLLTNSEMLFATIYLTLSSIYHIHGMIYCVLSEPCVYIRVHNRNMRALYAADDIGMHALYSPTPTVTHYRLGGWRVHGAKTSRILTMSR